MSFSPCSNWRIEGHSTSNTTHEPKDPPIPYYETYFVGRRHHNFISPETPLGAVIVSYFEGDGLYHILLRSATTTQFSTATRAQVSQHQSIFSWLFFLEPSPSEIFSAIDPRLYRCIFTPIKYFDESSNSSPSTSRHSSSSPSSRPSSLRSSFGGSSVRYSKLEAELLQLEKPNFGKKYKFGLVYCGPNQTHESDMMGNASGSEEFEEFLNFIGKSVQLQGFTDFDGGLDVKHNLTGTNSIYSVWRGAEIMWHVNTLLPLLSADKQHLERKKHIGNDRVVIVFRDSHDTTSPFSPDIFHSKQNHIIAIVQPTDEFSAEHQTISSSPNTTSSTDTTTPEGDEPSRRSTKYYKFSVASKETVPKYGPSFPSPAIFPKDQTFIDFFFEKLTSGVDASSYSTEFKLLMDLLYRKQFGELVKKYTPSDD